LSESRLTRESVDTSPVLISILYDANRIAQPIGRELVQKLRDPFGIRSRDCGDRAGAG